MERVVDLVGLRAEAHKRLKSEGFVRIPALEAMYAASLLGGAFTEKELGLDPAVWLEYEFEVLGLGKWEWLLTWLSPMHLGTALVPDQLGEIAAVWLGHHLMPRETSERLSRVWEAWKRS